MDLNHEQDHSLDLSLGLPQQQDPVEEQDQGQLQSMQPLTSSDFDLNISLSLDPPMSDDSSDSKKQQKKETNDSKNHRHLNIDDVDLSLGLPQEQDPVEEQDQYQLQVMQPAQAFQLFSPPYEPSGQALHPPQLNQAGTVALENPPEILPPYPWATTEPAVIHTIRYMFFNNIYMISGQVNCKPCNRNQTLEYNLMEKFLELRAYIKGNKEELRQRAPPMWLTPELIPCGTCQSGMKPVISKSKKDINWLFLLLGQMLGCCTLEQLKYFCHKNSQHQTGAKDRVLYITYLGLCKQLDPDGSFSLWQ